MPDSAPIEPALAALVASHPPGEDGWDLVAREVEALVRVATAVTGAFALQLAWDGRAAAVLGAELAWEPDGPQSTDRAAWPMHAAGDLAAARAEPRVLLVIDWECRDGAGHATPTAWPELALPSVVGRVLRSVATGHPAAPGKPLLLRPVVGLDVVAEGQRGTAHAALLGSRVGPAHSFDCDLPPGAELTVTAALQSSGTVSMMSLMADLLRAGTGR